MSMETAECPCIAAHNGVVAVPENGSRTRFASWYPSRDFLDDLDGVGRSQPQTNRALASDVVLEREVGPLPDAVSFVG